MDSGRGLGPLHCRRAAEYAQPVFCSSPEFASTSLNVGRPSHFAALAGTNDDPGHRCHRGAAHPRAARPCRGQSRRQAPRHPLAHGTRRRLRRHRHEPALCVPGVLQTGIRHRIDAGKRLRRALADRVGAHAGREREVHPQRDAGGQSRRRRPSRHARAHHRQGHAPPPSQDGAHFAGAHWRGAPVR